MEWSFKVSIRLQYTMMTWLSNRDFCKRVLSPSFLKKISCEEPVVIVHFTLFVGSLGWRVYVICFRFCEVIFCIELIDREMVSKIEKCLFINNNKKKGHILYAQ